ncbi:MAG: hypothetical protein JXB49_26940 [Bacteroidales bacterium]|nr:hypothetical protein [Bacteroidales bacterium]
MRNILYYSVLLAIAIILVYACTAESLDSSDAEVGKAGSMARFTIANNHLYTVDNNNLKLFTLTNPAAPQYAQDITIGVGIETIFPYGNNLFIGSQQGMFIYDINVPNSPQLVTVYEHVYSCDPVVVEGDYAYVTLHSEDSRCGRWTNELQIIDISDLSNPIKVKTISMNNPRGLGIDNGVLFVCDNGLKVYDATDTPNLIYKSFHNIKAYDVIPNNNLLLVIGEDGLYQYHYDSYNLTFLSLLPSIKQ